MEVVINGVKYVPESQPAVTEAELEAALRRRGSSAGARRAAAIMKDVLAHRNSESESSLTCEIIDEDGDVWTRVGDGDEWEYPRGGALRTRDYIRTHYGIESEK